MQKEIKMSERSAYCRLCGIYFEMPDQFDERVHRGVCPMCKGALLLTQKSLTQVTKDLGLFESEIGSKVADYTSQHV